MAVGHLAETIDLIPYANELHAERFVSARDLIVGINGASSTNVINDDFINIRTQKGSFAVLYLNPPYDYEKESGREEYRWLKRMRPLMATGGLLVWVIPELILKDRNVQKYMASWFTDMAVYRFIGEEYEAFKQVIFYGIKRKEPVNAAAQIVKAIQQLSTLGEDLPQHPMFDEAPYDLSDIQVPNKFFFHGISPTIEAINEEVVEFGNQTRSDYRDHMNPKRSVKLDPLAPMKIGHIASNIAAGHLNNQVIDTDAGQVLIKGSVYTEPVASTTTEAGENSTKYKTITIHDPRSVITTLNKKGEVEELKNDRLAEFLSTNINPITDKIQTLFPPRYKFDLTYWKQYLKGVNPRRIPNTDRKGLLPAQAHSVAAVCEQHESTRDAVLVGEVGTGKTVMAISAAYAQHNKYGFDHFIVMCPSHLVKKWIREVGLTWPKAKAMPLTSAGQVDKFYATKGPIFGVIKSTKASLGSGWTHQFWYGGPMEMKQRSLKGKLEIVRASKRMEAALHSNAEHENHQARQRWIFKQRVKCPSCWGIQMTREKKSAGERIPMDLKEFRKKKLYCEHCGEALWSDVYTGKNPRYPLATYITRHYKMVNDILIVDEAHQYKGSTDRGKAYAQMIRASKRIIAMTGTIYGGKSKTLFMLLYRLSEEFRQEWTDRTKRLHHRMEENRWAKTYGVVKETITITESHDSKSSGNRRPNKTTTEAAGSSPAMLPWLLNRSVFVSLQDMGMALPDFKEEAISVPMDGPMSEQYDVLYSDLKLALRVALMNGNRGILSKYLNTLIYFPDASWRPKVVEKANGDILTQVPGTGRPLGEAPKEAAILEYIQGELAEGRKCLLMVAQTNTLNIQPQWQDFLSQHDISSAILTAEPNKREAWINRQHKKGTQVIISHPKKIETGLDILEFPTIIWMAPEFSIYTVIQASGRAFRLGQTKDCKVVHFAYSGTLQTDALRLVIAKSAAAKRVNGDSIESDDLADLDHLATSSIEQALGEIMKQSTDYDAKMAAINVEYELALEGVFEDHFVECDSIDDAKKLYKELAIKYHPDKHREDEPVVESLSDLFAKANKEFKTSTSYIGGEEMPDDDDIAEKVEVEEEPVVEEKPFVPPEKVEEPVEEPAPQVEQPRLVFGQSMIKVTKRSKPLPKDGAAIQLALFS